jgi:NitT/TauT family transport system substrate-binding protein
VLIVKSTKSRCRGRHSRSFSTVIGHEKSWFITKRYSICTFRTGKAAAAFVGGQVDAVAVFAPFTTQALKRSGSKELFSSKDFPGAISDHLVFTRKFLDANPEKVQTWSILGLPQ